MERLTYLFAEDIEDQITLEASLGGIADETEDIIIGVMEDRNPVDNGKVHLFENAKPVNDDGLTADEEQEIIVAMLNDPDSEVADLLDDDDIDDL